MIDPTKVVADWEQDYKLMQDQRAEIARLRLTDEEREAIEFFADIHADDEPPHEYAVTLRSLLNRVK